MAVAADRNARLFLTREGTLADAGRRSGPDRLAANDRKGKRRMVPLWHARRPADRPAHRGRQAVVFEDDPSPSGWSCSARLCSPPRSRPIRPNAFLVARLSLVAPDGAATRISYGVLNLTHRDSHAEPSPLVPGQRYRITLKLNDVGQAVPAGHRLRLALTNAYWPTVWPSPQETVTIYPGESRLDLPVRPPREEDATPSVRATRGKPSARDSRHAPAIARAARRDRPDRRAPDGRFVQGSRRRADRPERHRERQRGDRDLCDCGGRPALGARRDALAERAGARTTGASARNRRPCRRLPNRPFSSRPARRL